MSDDQWYRRQRELDIKEVWPRMKREAGGDIAAAKDAFARYCLEQEAWAALGEAVTAERIASLDG